GKVAMLWNAIGAKTFMAFGKQERFLRLAPRAAHPAHTARDDRRGLYHSRLQQGNKRQQDARRIASGRGNQGCSGDFFTMNFRNSENGIGKEMRCAVFVSVKFPKQGWVTQPEVRAQIDDLLSRFDERRG